jgi:LuxR family transcriptional regulator, maltose regulon positive regulatory protein
MSNPPAPDRQPAPTPRTARRPSRRAGPLAQASLTLTTKLLIPPPARHLVERKRLYDALDAGVREGVVLLSAPAGAGKTVLLSAWSAARTLPGQACWMSLEADDNLPTQLLDDLLCTLGAAARAPDTPLGALFPTAGMDAERSLALLVNALAALQSTVVLILDEVHVLTNPPAIAALDFLVRHAPAQLRIVLAGRADPPLHIERLRASGTLTELRIADLAFDRQETATLCNHLEMALTPAELDTLWERTEGWPAAVRLACLSLREHPEPARFLAEFAGTDRTVADYLIAEVLARLPGQTREFMLHTCLVDTVSPELADALTGGEGGTLPLAELERIGAPVQPTAMDGHRYRYHPLFAELLRAHLRHAHPEQIPELHRRAARWYAHQGEVMSAIRHAIAGEDWPLAGELIAEHWLELFLHGGAAAMSAPIARLPRQALAAHPRLAAAVAGSRLQDGELHQAELLIALAREQSSAEAKQASNGHGSLQALLAAVTLRRARLRVDAEEAQRNAQELIAASHSCTRRCSTALRSFALCELSATQLWSGVAIGETVARLEEALALATEHGHEQLALDCLSQLAAVALLRGELNRAERFSARAVKLAERHGWCEGSAAAAAYLTAGACAYQRGEFEHAEGLLTRAASAAQTAEAPVRLTVSVLQALTLAAGGEQSAARGALKLLAVRSELAEGAPVPAFLIGVLDVAEPRVLMAAGDVEQARATLAAALQRTPDSAALLVRQASLELRDGEADLALASLMLARTTAARQTPPPPLAVLLEASLLQALARQAIGDLPEAFDCLEQALALAEREPLRAAFLLNGPAVRELLELAAAHGTAHPALLEVLLDGVDEGAGGGGPIAEPLTEREQRILRYLPTMLTNAEIGAEVFVSLNTVKTHLRSIYRKLDASNRAEAVAQARKLGLLPAGIKRPRVVQRV